MVLLMIKKFKSIKQYLGVIAVFAILLFSNYNNQQIYGHNFAGDESASFLALMDQMQTEMNLINTNLADNNQPLAKEHLNNIEELYTKNIKKEIAERNKRVANDITSVINETHIAIEKNNQDISNSVENFNDIIEETISVRIDQEALTNATVQALHFADLINSIDVSYATAVGTEPINMSAMSMSAMNIPHGNDNSMSHGNDNSMSHGNDNSMSHGNDSNTMSSNMNMNHGDSNSSMVSMSKDKKHNSNTTETSIITNLASYQTAKELTNVAIDLFNSTIKQSIPSNATENANTIESNLQQLKDMVESKAQYNKVIEIIHGPIQTTMLETFNLPLKNSK